MLLGMGRFLRILFVVGFFSMQQIAVTDARIVMLPNGITTVGKSFRAVCRVIDERFVGWFDLNGNEVTARLTQDSLVRDKYYVEERGSTYTLVIRNVLVADGGNYTCKGDKTEKIFTLFVEFFVTEFPADQSLFVGRSQIIRCSAEGFPKPTFNWYKNLKRVKFEQDPRFTLLSNGSLLINPVHETDTADYICLITQLGDQEGTSLREQWKDIKATVYGPPRINFQESTNRTDLYSYVGNPLPITINCVWWGYPKPTLSIRKDNKPLPSEDVAVDAPDDSLLSYLEATVTTDAEEDFGDYTCHASNSYGSATHVVVISEAGPPSSPKNITFSTTCDHVTVAWRPPDSDGGLPLTRYTVELKDTNGWSDAVFVGVKTKRFTFTSREGVKPGTLYTVKVQAFNELNEGEIGEGSVTSAYCPPSGLYEITNTATWLNSSSFTLKWTRPPHDGGDSELRYDVEYSKETTDGKYVHWITRKNIVAQESNVTGLEGGSKYKFRVFVSNIAGRKREPARKEFNVYSDIGVTPIPVEPPGRIDEQLVYDMSVNCTSFYMQVDFVLKSRYLDTETFRFDNNSCGSHTATSEHVSLRTPLDACGTTRRESSDAVTYFNKVVAETKGQATIYIVEFPFSCSYRTHQTIGVPSFQPRKKVTYFEEGFGNFSFEMGLYRNPEYTSPYDVSDYPVNVDPFGQLYCEAKLDTSDSGLVLLADTCVATPSMDPSHSVQYTFIDGGCPVDNGTYYDRTMTQTQRFQLVPFRWIPQNFTLVYLHCNVIVCHKDDNSRCSMGCQSSNRRRARSTGKEDMHRVTLGPIRLREPRRSTSDILKREPVRHSVTTHSSSGMPLWIIILCVCGAVVGLCLVLYGAVYLVLLLTSTSRDAPAVPVQTKPEEMELFCDENI